MTETASPCPRCASPVLETRDKCSTCGARVRDALPPQVALELGDAEGPRHAHSRTTLYEVIGGPRDGDVVRVLQRARRVRLNDEPYRVQWWVKRDGEGRRLWERECLVWERMS